MRNVVCIASPDDIVIVSKEKALAMLANVVNDGDACHEENCLLVGSVVEIVPALVTPVSEHPLQAKLRLGRCLVAHFRVWQSFSSKGRGWRRLVAR